MKNLLSILAGVLFSLAVGLFMLVFLGVLIVVVLDHKLITELEKSTFTTIVLFAWFVVNLVMAFPFKTNKSFFYTQFATCALILIFSANQAFKTFKEYKRTNEQLEVENKINRVAIKEKFKEPNAPIA